MKGLLQGKSCCGQQAEPSLTKFPLEKTIAHVHHVEKVIMMLDQPQTPSIEVHGTGQVHMGNICTPAYIDILSKMDKYIDMLHLQMRPCLR